MPTRVEMSLPPLLPYRAPLLSTPQESADHSSSLCTLTHVLRAPSASEHHTADPTLIDKPVVTPRLPVRSARHYRRISTDELRLSSSKNGQEPPDTLVAVRMPSCETLPTTLANTMPGTVVRNFRVHRRCGVPGRGNRRPKRRGPVPPNGDTPGPSCRGPALTNENTTVSNNQYGPRRKGIVGVRPYSRMLNR